MQLCGFKSRSGYEREQIKGNKDLFPFRFFILTFMCLNETTMNNTEKTFDFIAHVRKEKDGSFTIQSVEEHSLGTATLCELFASVFGAGLWGRITGQFHDVGKYIKDIFQPYIRDRSGMIPASYKGNKPDHSSAGAILARERLPYLYQPIAYCVAGHHSGLPDKSDLDRRLKKIECLTNAEKYIPDEIRNTALMPAAPLLNNGYHEFHLWIRMLFSCLVDADYLDTEKFMQPEKSAHRKGYKTLSRLKILFDEYMEHLSQNAPDTLINRKRAYILQRCRETGSDIPGLYNLTVPTGGGKTLASIAWALEHALKYGKDRIIIAIPYTSIIAQTAAILRNIFGNENVIEHHSNLLRDSPNENEMELLATENWDAPVIVTTNVQFFESLYACKTSRCRKLHNICNSVVILDEAQMLQPEYLKPILHILQGLQSSFKTSVLFCTATQPVFEGVIGSRKASFMGLTSPVKEIIPDGYELFSAFKRVHIDWKESIYSFDKLAEELAGHKQVLCVVNTRKEAQELFRRMPKDGIRTVHLSRMMCSVHIMKVIDEIKEKLNNEEPIRVISTQLIEAGVDIDFPVVYRVFAGLESIIQAAGRCNREGKLETGTVIVIRLEGSRLQGLMNKAASALSDLLNDTPDKESLTTPALLKKYFSKYFERINTFDKPETEEYLYKGTGNLQFRFATYARNFQLIDDKDSVSILVGYESGANLIERLKNEGPSRELLRELQQYSVTIRKWDYEKLIQKGLVKDYGKFSILESGKSYDSDAGVMVENSWVEETMFS